MILGGILFASCNSDTKGGSMIQEIKNNIGKFFMAPFRKKMNSREMNSESDKLAMELYGAIIDNDVAKINILLSQGANPNFCIGEYGWIDSNPIDVLVGWAYNTYPNKDDKHGVIVDEEIINILYKAGADINKRPYIWRQVYEFNDFKLRPHNEISSEEEKVAYQLSRVKDSNRVILALIACGANPDMKGHQYPYSLESIESWIQMTDKKANQYFSKGTRPLNEAIKKGIIWESQVDLLLEYVELDEASLKAAEASGDIAMIKKIQILWEKQQKEKPLN